MAFKALGLISFKAKKKWNLIDTLVIHRYGKLKVNEKIVLVATFSKHRIDSMESCNYIMNYLKKYNLAIFIHGCFWHRHQGCSRCNRCGG